MSLVASRAGMQMIGSADFNKCHNAACSVIAVVIPPMYLDLQSIIQCV